jgi:secondary thiamine-phosphate synthase enzyme
LKAITVKTRRRCEFIDITSEVARAVKESDVDDGFALVYVPHTTAGVTINENADPDVVADVIDVLERLVPPGAGYRHREGNADSHVKASMMGSSVTVPVAGGTPALGTWQGIYFTEFDGPRTRRTIIEVIGNGRT